MHKNKLYEKKSKQNFPSKAWFSLATKLYFYNFYIKWWYSVFLYTNLVIFLNLELETINLNSIYVEKTPFWIQIP